MSAAAHTETILWMIRHPEPDDSACGHCYGSLEVALSGEGIRHAHAIAAALANRRFAAIYTSPRQRCTETARILAQGRGCSVRPAEALREIDFGAFEGRSYEEIAASDPEAYQRWMEHPTEAQFPGGESFQQMSERVLRATHALLAQHAGEEICFVTHGGAIRAILADALGVPRENLFRLGQRYGAINRIRYVKEVPLVDLVNASSLADRAG